MSLGLTLGFTFLFMWIIGSFVHLRYKTYGSEYAKIPLERRRRLRQLLIRFASSKEITDQEGNDLDRLTIMVDQIFEDLPPP